MRTSAPVDGTFTMNAEFESINSTVGQIADAAGLFPPQSGQLPQPVIITRLFTTTGELQSWVPVAMAMTSPSAAALMSAPRPGGVQELSIPSFPQVASGSG